MKKRCLNYFRLIALCLSFVCLPVKASGDLVSNWDQVTAIVDEYSWVGSAAGAGFSYLSAKAHNKMVESYMKRILDAIDELNKKLDLLRRTTCNIYQHQTNQDYVDFRRKLTDYMSRENKHVFYLDLYNLQLDSGSIIAALEDHTHLLSDCALDQYEFLALYVALTNLDMSLQAEYIRQSYYISYRQQGDGSLIPLARMNPSSRATMDDLINHDIKRTLKERLSRIIQHLKVLDGSSSNYSWRKRSDARFSSLSSSQDRYRENGRRSKNELIRTIKTYSFNGQTYRYLSHSDNFATRYGVCCESKGRRSYRHPLFSNANRLWLTIPKKGWSADSCIYRKKRAFRSSRVISPVVGACTHHTWAPQLASIYKSQHKSRFSGDFAYLNNRKNYKASMRDLNYIYNKHRDDQFKSLVQSELVPIVALIEKWRSEVNEIDALNVPDMPPLPTFVALSQI